MSINISNLKISVSNSNDRLVRILTSWYLEIFPSTSLLERTFLFAIGHYHLHYHHKHDITILFIFMIMAEINNRETSLLFLLLMLGTLWLATTLYNFNQTPYLQVFLSSFSNRCIWGG